MGIEIIFLFLMGLIWITFATVQDIKTREIANWLNFSLIIFALGFRFFYSLFNLENFNFFYQGIFGLILFFIIGNLFYKLKLFAGGDAKLMIALGTILPLNVSFFQNFYGFFYFLLLFLFAGSLYGLIMSIYLGIKNFKKLKKEFSKEFKKRRKLFILTTFLSLILCEIY
jgi:Flp pilus assembly protein protease CpaA